MSELNYSVGYSAPSQTFRVLILHFLLWMGRWSRFKGRLRARGGGGGYSQKNWVGLFNPRRGLNREGAYHSPKIFDLNFRKFRSRMERVGFHFSGTAEKVVLNFQKSFPEKMLFHSIPTRNFRKFRRIESTHQVFVTEAVRNRF